MTLNYFFKLTGNLIINNYLLIYIIYLGLSNLYTLSLKVFLPDIDVLARREWQTMDKKTEEEEVGRHKEGETAWWLTEE